MSWCPGACTLAQQVQRRVSLPTGYSVSTEYRCACDRRYHSDCLWPTERLRAQAARLRAQAARIEAEVTRREEAAR